MKTTFIIFFLWLLLGISACGNKGPLTHEDEEEKKTERVDY